jgi:hypothetical protein
VINTPYDEKTPVLHPDGKTLFFASEGHNTMGKLDIFYSHLKIDSTWSEPVNIGIRSIRLMMISSLFRQPL